MIFQSAYTYMVQISFAKFRWKDGFLRGVHGTHLGLFHYRWCIYKTNKQTNNKKQKHKKMKTKQNKKHETKAKQNKTEQQKNKTKQQTTNKQTKNI